MVAELNPGVTPFGTLDNGEVVQKITLGDGTLSVSLITLGAILQDVRLKGVSHSLTIGTEDLAAYVGDMRSCGSLIGPVVNRISGGSSELDGARYEFERNQDGQHTRHCGSAGTQRKTWRLLDHSGTHVDLGLTLPAGEGGFPGTREIAARFSLPEPGVLEMRVTATSDAPTWINFANHSYWNLDGTDTYAGHSLKIAADRYCVSDDTDMATGEVRSVGGTAFDYRAAKTLVPGTDPKLDMNMCVSDAQMPLRDVLELTGTTGTRMVLATTEPGVQIYDANGFGNGGATGHDGKDYDLYCGLAIEAQGWPDAPNQPHFPSVVLRPGETYQQVTRWRFSKT